MSETALSPCKFCQATYEVWVVMVGVKLFQVVCHKCHARGPISMEEVDAMTRWNKLVCP